jgi:succinate dehydrogenase flavin-adding protein (antitoxin of CptAB toxin-antitoxin module)
MRDYDSWLTEFLDYEDDNLTDEEREELEALRELYLIQQYEENKLD